METLRMSLNERDRLALFSRVRDGQMTLIEASRRLEVSYRQAKRLWRGYRRRGDAGLVHGLRGRASNNAAAADGRREKALALYGERYGDFGPTLAAEQLAARDGLVVNHETLRGWLIHAGLWQAQRQPRRRHRRRERRPCLGELVQLDGSDHAWFGQSRPRCALMVMIDDATSLMHARFFAAETTAASMTMLRQWTLAHGLVRTLYPDRHSIYRRNDKQADEIAHRTGVRPLTRFGEAMRDLGVKLTCAHSPQAKGRVERVNATLQDRLVKLLRLEGITDIDAANTYLEQTFLPAHNARFTVAPADEDDAHRPAPSVEELDAALCPNRERRVVDKVGCVSWQGRCFQLLGKDAPPGAPRRRREVVVRQRLDGRVELVALDENRVLASRELPGPPAPPQPAKRSLAERVADATPRAKPAGDHPWRKTSLAGGGSVAVSCAHLHYAAPREPTQGTLLLG
jgi:hypothetical protein